MRVAVGADVEPGDFLRAQMRRDRVLVLLAPARVDHRLEKTPTPICAVCQAGRGSEPMIEVGSRMPAEALYISPPRRLRKSSVAREAWSAWVAATW